MTASRKRKQEKGAGANLRSCWMQTKNPIFDGVKSY
jgi:hypothetical protein